MLNTKRQDYYSETEHWRTKPQGKTRDYFLMFFTKTIIENTPKKHNKCTRLSYSAGDKKPLTIVVQLDLLGLGR